MCVCVTIPASSKSAFGGNTSRVPPVTLMDFTLEVRPAGRLSEGSGLLAAWAPPELGPGDLESQNTYTFQMTGHLAIYLDRRFDPSSPQAWPTIRTRVLLLCEENGFK